MKPLVKVRFDSRFAFRLPPSDFRLPTSDFRGFLQDMLGYTLRAACRSAAPGLRSNSPQLLAARFYHERIVDHYESPRNVGSLDKTDPRVGTGLVGAPACGDVMKLQMRVGPDGVIEEAVFKVCTMRLCRRRRAASVPAFCRRSSASASRRWSLRRLLPLSHALSRGWFARDRPLVAAPPLRARHIPLNGSRASRSTRPAPSRTRTLPST